MGEPSGTVHWEGDICVKTQGLVGVGPWAFAARLFQVKGWREQVISQGLGGEWQSRPVLMRTLAFTLGRHHGRGAKKGPHGLASVLVTIS